MIDAKDMKIAKMNALAHVIEVHKFNKGPTDQIDLAEVVKDADKLVSWILNPSNPYIINKPKETK